MAESEYGPLAEALAKAQAAFPTIGRNKEVTVQTKAGGSYKFKYAPLDTILEAVRGPLAANGLAISQLLDDDYLVTVLLHSRGARLTGRTPIPGAEGIQAFGSAITYLRRYSIVALLGIATEEDDDGNRHAGNDAKFGGAKEALALPDVAIDGLIGTATKEKKVTTDFALRQSPDGPFIGFRLKNGAETGFICEVRGDMATVLATIEADFIGKRVQVWGTWVEYKPPTVQYGYKALRVTRVQTPDYTLPAQEVGGRSETEAAGPVDERSGPAAPTAAEWDAEIAALPIALT